MIIFGFDTSTINWYLVAYALSSILFLVYGTQKVYATGQLRGALFALGAAWVLILFGVRLFGKPPKKFLHWPPVINTCPDYLTYIPSLSDGQPGCIDLLGVTNSSAGLKLVNPSEVPSLSSNNADKVFPYTSEDVTKASSASAVQIICDTCKSAGITWEGVYDGNTCVGIHTSAAKQEAVDSCLVKSDVISSHFTGL
jgi:hypothetical protein